MSDKTNRELRDELVMRMTVTHFEFTLNHPELMPDWRILLKDAFEIAEHFLAARYDADTAGLYKEPKK